MDRDKLIRLAWAAMLDRLRKGVADGLIDDTVPLMVISGKVKGVLDGGEALDVDMADVTLYVQASAEDITREILRGALDSIRQRGSSIVGKL